MVVPLFVGRDKSIKALEYAMSKEKEIFLSAQKDAKVDNPGQKDIFLFGTLGTVLQLLRLPDGTVKALIEGKQRAKIDDFVIHHEFFMVRVRKLPRRMPSDEETRGFDEGRFSESFDDYAKLNEKIGKDLVDHRLQPSRIPAGWPIPSAAHLSHEGQGQAGASADRAPQPQAGDASSKSSAMRSTSSSSRAA